jgi:hypothetical protein
VIQARPEVRYIRIGRMGALAECLGINVLMPFDSLPMPWDCTKPAIGEVGIRQPTSPHPQAGDGQIHTRHSLPILRHWPEPSPCSPLFAA